MTRAETIAKILRARTPDELREARFIRAAYLREHPKDYEVLETGNYVTRLEEALEIISSSQPVLS